MDTSTVLRTLLNDQDRAELLGRDTAITQVEVAPDTSIVLGLADNRWARVLWPTQHSSAKRVADWARHYHLWESTTQLSRDILLQQGELKADEKLAPHLVGMGGSTRVLRYTPSKRVVLRPGNHVIEVSHRRFPQHQITGVPSEHAPELDAIAGMVFARLHRLPPPEGPCTNVFRRLAALAQLFRYLNPILAARLNWIAGHVEELGGTPVFSHGDASPARVLTDGTQLWLTNFERACGGPAAVDVGSYVETSDSETGERFISGYTRAGGKLPNARALRHARAQAKLLRIADPLRQGHADWETEIFAELDAVKELVL